MLRPYKMPSRIFALRFGFGANGDGKGKQIDEAFRVFRVITAHLEAGEVGSIKREGRNALGDVTRAFPQFQADSTGDALLRHIEKSIERLAQRREPQAVINEFGVAIRKRLLEVCGLAVDGEPFELLVRFHEQSTPGSFVSAARLHADESVFDEVGAADTVLCGNFVELVQKIDGTEL